MVCTKILPVTNWLTPRNYPSLSLLVRQYNVIRRASASRLLLVDHSKAQELMAPFVNSNEHRNIDSKERPTEQGTSTKETEHRSRRLASRRVAPILTNSRRFTTALNKTIPIRVCELISPV